LIRLETQLDFIRQHIPDGAALIVLPESAVVNPQLFPGQVALFSRLALERHLSFVIGVAQATKFDQPPVTFEPEKPQLRSEAWVLTATQNDPLRHVKSQLVPFAEARPLKSWLQWPEWLVPSRPEVVRGPSPRSFPIAEDIRVGIMICWESLFAHHARALVDDGAMVLIMLANEGWFGGGAAGAQHNLTARIRAVEFRRSVVVSSNMGPPLVVNPYGQVLDSGSVNATMQWSSATIPILSDPSWYSRLGDALVLGCALLVASYAISASIRKRRGTVVRLTPLKADDLPVPPMVIKGGSRPPGNEAHR
jgi:apolipoprotein N-acyltransferase